MSTLAHHGIIYVPLGYKTTFGLLADVTEVRGGSPWGAGTFSVSRLDVLNTPPIFRLLSFVFIRVRTVLANPLLKSWNSLRSRVRPFMVLYPKSTSLD
jgi:hypothetical protein